MKIIKLSKRLLSFILAIAIITSLLPMSMVFADTTDLDTTSPVLKVYNGTTNKPNPNAGDSVTITANSPPEGAVFNKWTSSDIEISSGNENKNSYTFTMPSKSVTLTANFKNSPDTESTVLEGLEALVSTSTTTLEKKIIPTFNLETKEHKLQLATTDYNAIYFYLPKEKIDGRRITVALDGVEHVLTANNNQTSTFKITKAISEFAIRVTSKNGANTSTYKIIVKRGMAIPRALNVINGTTANTSPAVGDEITITADTPDVGKIFDKWISPDVSIQKPSISQTTFTMVDKDVTILATYKNDPELNNTLEHFK